MPSCWYTDRAQLWLCEGLVSLILVQFLVVCLDIVVTCVKCLRSVEVNAEVKLLSDSVESSQCFIFVYCKFFVLHDGRYE
jgi:hypothetical protein